MCKRVHSSRGHVSAHVGALLALQRSEEHPQARSITAWDARVIFRPAAASSRVSSSGSSKQRGLFLDRLAGSTGRDGGFTPPPGAVPPRCTPTRRSERQSLLVGGWRRTAWSARLFAIPMMVLGYRLSSRTSPDSCCLPPPGSSNGLPISAASQSEELSGAWARPFFRWRPGSKWRSRRVLFK